MNHKTTENPPSLRERRAQLTRDEILRAARRLFAERGYARTSVRDVAQAAGVSAQTVYDSVGSKHELVSQLNDLIDAEAGVAAIVRAAAESGDPWELAAAPARVTRSIIEHCGDIVLALVSGAASEPELAAVLAEGHRRHLEGAGRIVAQLRSLDALGSAAVLCLYQHRLLSTTQLRRMLLPTAAPRARYPQRQLAGLISLGVRRSLVACS